MARLSNRDVAGLFAEMADLLTIRGNEPHRARSFQRAARIIENLELPVEQALAWGTLQKRRGVGEGTIHRLRQILRTGTCDDLQRLRAALPGLNQLLEVRGLGPSTIRRLYQHFRIRNLEELEAFARSGRLLRLPRFGPEQVHKVLAEIDVVRRRGRARVPLHEARRAAAEIAEVLRGVPGAQQVAVAGSCRRGKSLVGDLDVLVAADRARPFVERFTHLDGLADVVQVRDDGASVRLRNLQQADLRVVHLESWGAALHSLTGSKLHNIVLRARANRRNLKLSDRGVVHRLTGAWQTTGPTEEEVFAALGLPFIPPELRENLGEIDAAERGELPRLVEAADLRGDLRVHATAGVGELARAATRRGLRYQAVVLSTVHHVDAARRIAAANGLEILAAVLVGIRPDGTLTVENDVLRHFDWVVARPVAPEGGWEAASWEAVTLCLERSFEHGCVDVLAQPTGRVLGESAGYPMDFERVLKAARRTGVALEVGGDPRRMDLDDVGCRQAKALRVPLALASTARSAGDLDWRDFALASARRGWLTAADLLNSRPLDEIRQFRHERLRRCGLPVPSRPEPARETEAQDARVEALAGVLREPLDDATTARLERFLGDGQDPVLEEALRRLEGPLGENPLQVAFNLILKKNEGR